MSNKIANIIQKGQKVAVQSQKTTSETLKVTLKHNNKRKVRPHARMKAIKLLQS